MSKDIRSFFTVISNKSQSKSSNSSSTSKKRTKALNSSDDDDVIAKTPTPVKKENLKKRRKMQVLSSDSEDEHAAKFKKSKRTNKTVNDNLKPVNTLDIFGSQPIKQSKIVEKKKPASTDKVSKSKETKKVTKEIGIPNDEEFEKTLLELDDDFLIENADQLDDNINQANAESLKALVPNNTTKDSREKSRSPSKVKNTPQKSLEKLSNKGSTSSENGKTPTSKRSLDYSDGDPDQEHYEKKRQSAILYQKYLNRSGPAHLGSKEIPKGDPNCFRNLTFIRTGVLDSIDNDEFEKIVLSHGGRSVHSMSRKVNYVVAGEEAGPSKISKATEYGIKIITEDEFLDLIRKGSEMKPIIDNKEVDKKGKLSKIKNTDKVSNNNHHNLKKDNLENKKSPNETVKIDHSISTKSSKVIPAELILKECKQEIKLENLPWTEKYKPTNIKGIIGQQGDKSNMKRLIIWLQNWYKNHSSKNRPKLIKPSPWSKNDDGSYFKAALLSGPPGVGKTTTANLVAKELGFDVVEFNASDTRSKKLLHEEVSQLLSTKSLAGYFADGSAPTNKHVLLMDEVDGMAGNEDRGGVQELIALIKNSNIPIICMCNDRNHPKIRSLVNYCLDLKFCRPRLEQIKGAMRSICYKEGIDVGPEALSEIISGAGMDVRQVLTNLSLWSTGKKALPVDVASKEANNAKKDTPLGPWEVCRKAFSAEEHKTMSISDRSRLFYYDYSLAPLFIQENYLKVLPHCPKNEFLKNFALAADAISIGDTIDTKIRRSNNWSLLDVEAMYALVLPGHYLAGHVNGQIDFPSWLGKNSKKNKFSRLLSELQAHMRTSISGSRKAVNLEYVTHLRNNIVRPLAKDGVAGVNESLEVMHSYNLLREDLDSILELALWPKQKDPMNMVDPKVKAAFTRAYNKDGAKLPYAIQMAPVKKRGAALNENDDYDEDEVESSPEDNDPSKDAMIKAKKTSSKNSIRKTDLTESKGKSRERKTREKKKK